jgi:hypothetical protein
MPKLDSPFTSSSWSNSDKTRVQEIQDVPLASPGTESYVVHLNQRQTEAILARAAEEEHSYTPWQAIRTYWRAFLWCM